MYPSPPYEYVCAGIKLLWKMELRTSVGGGLDWLESSNLNPEVGQSCSTLTSQIRIRRRGVGDYLAGDGEPFTVHKIRG